MMTTFKNSETPGKIQNFNFSEILLFFAQYFIALHVKRDKSLKSFLHFLCKKAKQIHVLSEIEVIT